MPLVCHEVKCWVPSEGVEISDDWASCDNICWDSPWAVEAAEAADENEELRRSREDELRTQKFLICYPEDSEAFAQRLGCKKKFFKIEDAQVHRIHEKCGTCSKDDFPVAVSGRGPKCLVCGKFFDLSHRAIELHRNMCRTPEQTFEAAESWVDLRSSATCDDWGWILGIAKEEAFGVEGWIGSHLDFTRLQTILWQYAVPQIKFFSPASARTKKETASAPSARGSKLVSFGLKTVTGSLARREKKAVEASARTGFTAHPLGISDYDYRKGCEENAKDETEKWKVGLEMLKQLAYGHVSDVFGDPGESDGEHENAHSQVTAGQAGAGAKKRVRKKLTKRVRLQNKAKKIVRAAEEKGVLSLRAPRALSHVSTGTQGIVCASTFYKKHAPSKCSQKPVGQPYSDALIISRRKKFKRIWEGMGSGPLVLLSDCTHWACMKGNWVLLNKLFTCGVAKKIRLQEKQDFDFGT